jgi:hypothetical protein
MNNLYNKLNTDGFGGTPYGIYFLKNLIIQPL